MPLEDYLLPKENIRYQSHFNVRYGNMPYAVVLTDIRLILYARKGLIFKNDNVVTEALREIQGIKYKESGAIIKNAYLEIQSTSKMTLTGERSALKTLYQRILPFLSPQLGQSQAPYLSMSPPYSSISQSNLPPEATLTSGLSGLKVCANCGTELPANGRFCHICGKPAHQTTQ